jgi:Protein of unknown function (DUF3775)
MADRTFDITLDPSIAFRIADLAREYASEGDGLYPHDDEAREAGTSDDPVLEAQGRIDGSHPPPEDPIENELRDLIEGLNIDAQKDLLALIWLARDSGSPDDWHHVRRQATETTHLHVAQYVEELAILGYEDDR